MLSEDARSGARSLGTRRGVGRWRRALTKGEPVRILVEPSDYVLKNVGDMAMMAAAVGRIVDLWPRAIVDVLSDDPGRLPAYGPNVRPLDAAGRRTWLRARLLPDRVGRHLPPVVRRFDAGAARWVRVRWPRAFGRFVSWRLRLVGHDARPVADYLRVLTGADLVLATGMGGVTDVFPTYAWELLENLSAARRCGAITAMMGQGLGPLDDRHLRSYAGRVLRGVDLIALRESRFGLPLARDVLRVEAVRLVTTGDDAIALASQRAPRHLGTNLGVNLRVSEYSGVDDAIASEVGEAVRRTAGRLAVELVPVPISAVEDEADLPSIERFVTGPGDRRSPAGDIDEVLSIVAGCRLVVTGSYHAAVFALSMGIPAIGLAGSPYYEHKFLGLADMFGPGCMVVPIGDAAARSGLDDLITDLWDRANQIRPSLLAGAGSQVERSRRAYERVRDLVEHRRDRLG